MKSSQALAQAYALAAVEQLFAGGPPQALLYSGPQATGVDSPPPSGAALLATVPFSAIAVSGVLRLAQSTLASATGTGACTWMRFLSGGGSPCLDLAVGADVTLSDADMVPGRQIWAESPILVTYG